VKSLAGGCWQHYPLEVWQRYLIQLLAPDHDILFQAPAFLEPARETQDRIPQEQLPFGRDVCCSVAKSQRRLASVRLYVWLSSWLPLAFFGTTVPTLASFIKCFTTC